MKGLAIQPASRMMWRDMANTWQDYRFGGAPTPVGHVKASLASLLPRVQKDRLPPSHLPTTSSGHARRLSISGTYGTGRTGRRASRLACANRNTKPIPVRPVEAKRTRARTLRCAARGRARGSACRSISTSAPALERWLRVVRSRSRATIASRLFPVPGDAPRIPLAMVGRLRAMGGSLDVRLPDLD